MQMLHSGIAHSLHCAAAAFTYVNGNRLHMAACQARGHRTVPDLPPLGPEGPAKESNKQWHTQQTQPQ
jgi:hypothetical protein